MKKLMLLTLATLFSLNIIAQNGIKKGSDAPVFTAVDNTGKTVDLKAVLKTHKAVLLFFYRGQWCPYCNKQMQHLQDSLTLLTQRGVYVVGVSPETEENIGKTVTKTHATFSLISDKGYRIMKAYDVNYTMDAGMVTKYKTYGVDLEANNGNTDHMLPVPATYLINKAGKITFAHFDKDYKKRATVAEIIAAM
ncbi:AhpC/TSA family protein [Mucilaginibacter sp. HMF5004]|uniref:peroxiredoxin-like family protein n=1 Tax=Mucilaginibacter rivuli TaxID=2857527 RepID=UPI001C5CF54D|nr:peroxiredoxin-like family protein [Mucilaginibacter rivuli]MBW4889449.1 AhpC/TSA family protein [Mucilaginibacter rivuli]